LTQIGKSVGLVSEKRWKKYQEKIKDIEKLENHLKNTHSNGKTLWDQLRQPNNTIAATLSDNTNSRLACFDKSVRQAVIIDAKYEGYLKKQKRLVANFKTFENKKIPTDLDYDKIAHLRAEAKQKLSAFRPETLAQASRISGITPADITVIQIHLKKYY